MALFNEKEGDWDEWKASATAAELQQQYALDMRFSQLRDKAEWHLAKALRSEGWTPIGGKWVPP